MVESLIANCLGAHSVGRACTPYGQSLGLNFDTPSLLLVHGSPADWKWYKTNLFLASKEKSDGQTSKIVLAAKSEPLTIGGAQKEITISNEAEEEADNKEVFFRKSRSKIISWLF